MSPEPIGSNEEVNLPKYAQQQIEADKRRAVLTEQVRRDLETNPRYKEFFGAYEPNSVKSFIDEYSWRKVFYLEHGERCIGSEEDDLLRFVAEGAMHLWNIQRKKLFNLECLWRAEKIELTGVEQTWDFRYWEHHLERCPFLPPITDEEVEAYTDYVLSGQLEDDDMMSWESLRFLSDTDMEEGPQYPEWYAFYDTRFDTPSLFNLPDIRGEKESFYRRLSYKEKEEKRNEMEKAASPNEDRPRIGYHDLDAIEAFIRRFEDKKLLRYFNAVVRYNMRHEDEEIESAIEMLECSDEPVPIEASGSWRDGLIKAADNFHRKKLSEGVRTAYREYLIRLESGVYIEDNEKDDFMNAIRKGVKEEIIRGRILNGEPPDLNF